MLFLLELFNHRFYYKWNVLLEVINALDCFLLIIFPCILEFKLFFILLLISTYIAELLINQLLHLFLRFFIFACYDVKIDPESFEFIFQSI